MSIWRDSSTSAPLTWKHAWRNLRHRGRLLRHAWLPAVENVPRFRRLARSAALNHTQRRMHEWLLLVYLLMRALSMIRREFLHFILIFSSI